VKVLGAWLHTIIFFFPSPLPGVPLVRMCRVNRPVSSQDDLRAFTCCTLLMSFQNIYYKRVSSLSLLPLPLPIAHPHSYPNSKSHTKKKPPPRKF
jgi:hypothetical protein